MGILSNTVSIRHYRVVGEKPSEDIFDWAAGCLAENRFHSIENSADELSIGWVHMDDPRENSFTAPRDFRRDHYLAFTLRRDQRRIPSALFKAYMAMAEERFLAENPGRQKVPKAKRDELKEAVRNSLLARTLPVPALHDLVWDTRNGLVTFTSLSSTRAEELEKLFKQTFTGLRLVAVHPFARAEALLNEPQSEALHRANRASTDAALDLIQGNRWLGCDFLLWLLFRTMDSDSRYQVNQPGPALAEESFVAYLNDRLVLLGEGDGGVQKITVAGHQDQFSEVRTALQAGKQIDEASLHLQKGEEEWKLTLKGELFHFATFKSPPVQIERDALTDAADEREAVFHERMYLLETGLQLFDSLFGEFLRRRLGDDWAEEEGQIRAWLSGDPETGR